MQGNRLFKILYHLLSKGSATASELAEKFEVSVRTIYRDIDALSGAGIPVYAEAGRKGGIRLMDDFVLDKALLSDAEKEDILSAVQQLSVANTSYAQDTLQKLSALFQLSAHDWYEIDFSRWGKKSQDNEKFEALKQAVINHIVVKIIYFNTSGNQDERAVWPLKLLYKSKEWYLKAFCTKKQDLRLFKLNRITHYELLEEKFLPVHFQESQEEDIQMMRICLRFQGEVAYRVYDEFDACQIERHENGDFIVRADMPETPWLIGYLLSFGTQVEVLEPCYLREMIAEEAKKIFEKNTRPNKP